MAEQMDRIEAGDTLEVFFWSEDEEPREVVVDSTGSIVFAPVGTLVVNGQTADEVTRRLVAELEKRDFRKPRIQVALKARAAASPQGEVYVLGAVARPGALPIGDGIRVMDAVGRSGGLAADADGARAAINRPGKGALPVDLSKLLNQGDMSQNIALEPGDMLVVPARQAAGTEPQMLTVFVSGQVTRPGTQQLPPGARVSDALSAAGGPLPTANLERVSLVRASGTVWVDLQAVLRKGDREADIPLQTQDGILVPEARNRITLLGEFLRPGSYTFREGDRLTDAVALGGGATEAADTKSAILRRGGKDLPVDLDSILRLAALQGNDILEDGDALVIPTGMRIYTLGAVQRPGSITLKRGANPLDALLAAGPTPNANFDKAGVLRMVDGKPERIPLNMKGGPMTGTKGQPFAFAENDVLYVPEKGRPFSWQSVLTAVSALTLFGLNPLSRRW